MMLALPTYGQEAAKKDTVSTVAKTETQNVMLNASSDNGPRNVNIGLPASIGGTTILENGLPVTYDFMGMSPLRAWRSSSSFNKFSVLGVAETAISIGDVGVSVSTHSNRGTEKLIRNVALNSNSFGLLRGDFSISGPIKNGYYYAVSANINMDPGTFDAKFTNYLDQTQIYKGVISKKYNKGKGEFAIQYKFADSRGVGSKVSPYVYNLNGTVSQYKDFKIGRDSYLERSGVANIINPMTGKEEAWDQMKDMGTTSHVIDIMGNNKLENGMVLDYIVRYNYAKSGLYNPYYSSPSQNPGNNDSTKYYYADGTQNTDDYVQGVTVLATPKIPLNTIMSRFDVSKKAGNHHWAVGLSEWFYNVSDYHLASSFMYQEAKANPQQLFARISPSSGAPDYEASRSYNGALQYYDGWENKLAIYATEKWTVNKSLQIDLGARLEWQHVDGLWYPKASRDAARNSGVKNNVVDKDLTNEVKKDWFNKAFSINLLYKMTNNFGLLADGGYTEVAGKLSSYAGADDPSISPSQIPSTSGGAYYNHPLLSVVSKATYIQRNNFKNNSTFARGHKQTITYDIETIGWTTDMILSPAKGFKLHLLLTLQNPEYKNFTVDLTGVPGEDAKHDFSGGAARSVSKTIIEIDPSYSFKTWRVWASARYFSKEAANYPNTLFFASRWETFAGVNYKLNKYVDFNVNAVNLLNQKGAQGSISGTNTTTADQAAQLDGKVLTGTYMRPFTIEFGTKVRF
ncbi:2,6-beta-D-fructofuranosidase [Bacteroidales bacterium]|nr:2,6-beta-D-fructofuranosidase [Bacteroidales bacterium]